LESVLNRNICDQMLAKTVAKPLTDLSSFYKLINPLFILVLRLTLSPSMWNSAFLSVWIFTFAYWKR